jgi:hypothetical protein
LLVLLAARRATSPEDGLMKIKSVKAFLIKAI